jgi:hypothetical protein
MRRTTEEIAQLLGRVAARLLSEGDPLRRKALDLLPVTSGLSPPMAEAVLDGMARDWTHRRLQVLLRSELDDPRVLDGFRAGAGGRAVRALGYPLTVHIGSGSVPGVSVTSLVRGLLVKSAVVLKPGRGDVALPLLFRQALEEEDPEVAAAVAVLYWPSGGDTSLGGREQMDGLLEAGDLVIAYGGDQVVREIRDRTPPTAKFLPFHHRVSFGVVGIDALGGERVDGLVADAARAVALFDQRGCVSPHVIYVEEGGEISPSDFARLLAGAMARVEEDLPVGELQPHEASAAQQLKGTVELEAASGTGVEVHGGTEARWAVISDPDPTFKASCLSRVVWVKPMSDPARLADHLQPVTHHLQTAAVEGMGSRTDAVSEGLVALGVTRITTFKSMPWPPPWWHHDGVEPLRSMIRWVDREEG